MTIEEKARAYDEALKRADSLTGKYGGRDFAEYVFPELAESDDERIRKALYEFISDTLGDEFDGYDFNKREALAYLEKQKPAEWSEDSVKIKEAFKAGRESGLRDGQKYVLNNLDSYGLCKLVEWSKEDKLPRFYGD